MANQRKGHRATYVVTSASLLRMQPPTVTAAPKVGARQPGLQGNKAVAERRDLRQRWGGKGFRSPPQGEEKAKDLITCLLNCIPQPPGENLTRSR